MKHNRFGSRCLQQHLLCKLEPICSTGRAQIRLFVATPVGILHKKSWLNMLGQEQTGVAAFGWICRGIWGAKQSRLGV